MNKILINILQARNEALGKVIENYDESEGIENLGLIPVDLTLSAVSRIPETLEDSKYDSEALPLQTLQLVNAMEEKGAAFIVKTLYEDEKYLSVIKESKLKCGEFKFKKNSDSKMTTLIAVDTIKNTIVPIGVFETNTAYEAYLSARGIEEEDFDSSRLRHFIKLDAHKYKI